MLVVALELMDIPWVRNAWSKDPLGGISNWLVREFKHLWMLMYDTNSIINVCACVNLLYWWIMRNGEEGGSEIEYVSSEPSLGLRRIRVEVWG